MKALLLPIRVHACALDQKQVDEAQTAGQRSDWWWRAPDYRSMASEALSGLSEVWTQTQKRALPAVLRGNPPSSGVLVSWTLPAAWLRSPGSDRKNAFDLRRAPRVPDLWCVVRIARRMLSGEAWTADKRGSEEPLVTAWVVEPGAPPNAEGAGSPALLTETGQLRPVGRVTPLQEYKECSKSVEPLTVYGSRGSPDLTFSGFAPANLNNLSFIDRLEKLPDLSDRALSYFVVGFYADLENDPVHKLRAEGLDDAKLRAALHLDDPIALLRSQPRSPEDESALLGERAGALRGEAREAAVLAAVDDRIRERLGLPPGAPLTLPPLGPVERVVMHGMVCHVDYWNPRSYLGPRFGAPQSQPRNPCSVQDGATGPLLALGANAEEALSSLLARATGGETSLDNAEEHVAAFAKALLQDTVATWDGPGARDRRRHAERSAELDPVPGGSVWSAAPLPREGADEDRAVDRELTDEERRLLVALNGKQAELDRLRFERQSAAENLYAAWWMQRCHAIDAPKTATPLAERVEELKRAVEALDRDIRNIDDPNAVDEKKKGELATARDALAKALVKRLGEGGFKLETSPAPPFWVPREPAVALRNMGARVPVRPLFCVGRTEAGCATEPLDGDPGLSRASLGPIVEKLGTLAPADALRALAHEAALAEEAVADQVRKLGEIYTSTSRQADWVASRVVLHDALGGAAPIPRGGVLTRRAPRTVRFATKEARNVPFGDVATGWIEQPWQPLFLDWKATWTPPTGNARSLSGRVLLAQTAGGLMVDRLRRLRPAGPAAKTALEDTKGQLTTGDVIGQPLHGLHAEILGRQSAMPRVRPLQSDALDALIAGTSMPPPCAPDTAFFSARGGTLELTSVWVVDRFGQAWRTNVSRAYMPAARSEDSRTLRLDHPLPPGFSERASALLEPHRLRVQWEADAGSSAASEAVGPGVCGWIVPSLLDHTVVIYEAGGTPVGVLGAGGALRSLRAPLIDPTLREIVEGLRSPGAFDQFMDRAHRFLAAHEGNVDPACPAARIGRPFAVVRLRVSLERRGGPLADPHWMRQPKQADTPTVAAWRDAGPDARVHVRVGTDELPDDGLLGFWAGAPGTAWEGLAAGPMQASARAGGWRPPHHPSEPAREETAPFLTLNAPKSAPSKALPLVALLDPQAKLVLEPDVLPVTAAQIPAEHTRAALRRLPAVLSLASAFAPSHAALRAALGEGGASGSVALPVPVRPTADTTEAAWIALAGRGEAPVTPLGVTADLPDAEIAAFDGILVL